MMNNNNTTTKKIISLSILNTMVLLKEVVHILKLFAKYKSLQGN